MNVKDKEIEKLLDRAKDYRNDLSHSMKNMENFGDLEELQEIFQEMREK